MPDQHKLSSVATTTSLTLTFALLSSACLTGCSMNFWKTVAAAESPTTESDAIPDSAEATADSVVTPESELKPDALTAAGSPNAPGTQDSPAAQTATVLASVESQLDALRTSLSRTAAYRKLRTKQSAAAFTKEATLQIDLGLAAAAGIIAQQNADLAARREAWKGRLTLLNRGEQLKLPEFAGRLDEAVAEATAQPDFQAEAEYGSGLLLVNRYFKSGQTEQALTHLQQHAREFPDGTSTVRLFLTFARDCGERGKFGTGILCCNLALWQLNNHPDIAAVRNLLENLQAGRTIDPSQDRVQQNLEEEVGLLRHELPIRIDQATTCTSITTAYHQVTFQFRVTLSAATIKAQEDKIKAAVTNMARTTYPAKGLLEKGISLRYVYVDRDGNELLRFNVSK